MRGIVLPAAKDDLREGIAFYEQQEPGLGKKYFKCIQEDLVRLQMNAGVHVRVGDWYRALSSTFETALFYKISRAPFE